MLCFIIFGYDNVKLEIAVIRFNDIHYNYYFQYQIHMLNKLNRSDSSHWLNLKLDRKLSHTRDQTHKFSALEDSQQFSFSKNLMETDKLSIREDLSKLPKQDLIQIVLQQIQQSKMLRIKLATMQNQCKLMESFRDQANSIDSLDEFVSMNKYKQLAQYMEQYINNTNQAQNHFVNLIEDLKANNKQLKQQNIKLTTSIQQVQKLNDNYNEADQELIKQQQQTIRNLQQSLAHYMDINNQHTRKYQKLKKMYQLLQQQLQIALQTNRKQILKEKTILGESNKTNIDKSSKNRLKNNQDLEQKIKILEIQNHELKDSWSAMERTVQSKSQKIRKLLQDIEKLSQQKWIYKQKYMQLKSKSYLFTQPQSNAKSSSYASSSFHGNQIVVQDFESQK